MAEKLCTRCQAPGGQFVIRGKDDSGAWLPWEEDTDRHAPAPFGKCRAMVVLSPVGICQMCEAFDLRAVKAAKPGPTLASRELFAPTVKPKKEKPPKRRRIPLEEKVQSLKSSKKAGKARRPSRAPNAKVEQQKAQEDTTHEVAAAFEEERAKLEEDRLRGLALAHRGELSWIDDQMAAMKKRRLKVDKARAEIELRLRRLRSQARTA